MMSIVNQGLLDWNTTVHSTARPIAQGRFIWVLARHELSSEPRAGTEENAALAECE
jgi:hypothetical protein